MLPVWPLGASGTRCHFFAPLEAINLILLRTLNAEMQEPQELSVTPADVPHIIFLMGHRCLCRSPISWSPDAPAGLHSPGSVFSGSQTGPLSSGTSHLLPLLPPPLSRTHHEEIASSQGNLYLLGSLAFKWFDCTPHPFCFSFSAEILPTSRDCLWPWAC